ncbi:MAG: alpha/beta hydrolase [Rhodoferax sp.]|nr:alpha/beta hydrolase [Betaproteobacteria bacterium]NCN98046.1 alpha/beta hydrolase [Rhodoferax sp.]PIZ22764.1 MAG: alpha/beta hydrolase [Comamonadaceae bacterium CG_4_10_14_0_8_um_filter_57_29]PJC16825.1 MAG: alpha/beta hydrolase [Comamonadaceae bacterium CG_4_9_14_0_8_um_filter_57_21]NCP82760.1 alpha/beta hydrolase [Rhodoferax sp.]
MKSQNVLILPGWQGSGAQHWQSLWQARQGYQRVDQHDWQRPLRGDWIARLEDVVLSTTEPAVLVAHSLGCVLVAAWAAHTRHAHLIKAALLVAPGDVEREALRPVLASWSPIPLQALPFKSTLVASHNDPYCSLERAQAFAAAWGSTWVDAGHAGHINADSGLGDWPAGQALLDALT